MSDNALEITEFTDEGYKPLIDYADWRVAILNYIYEIKAENNERMERHVETDEVFVLLKGQAVLLMGGNGPAVTEIQPVVMKAGKLYNVKRNAWHGILMSLDGSVLLVENKDTGDDNSEYFTLTPAMRSQIVEIGKTYQIEN